MMRKPEPLMRRRDEPAFGWFLPVPEPAREPTPEPAPEPPPERLMLNVAEAAEMLGIGSNLTRRLIMDGTLRSFKIGGRRLIRTEDVRAFVAGMTEDIAGRD